MIIIQEYNIIFILGKWRCEGYMMELVDEVLFGMSPIQLKSMLHITYHSYTCDPDSLHLESYRLQAYSFC